MPWACFALSQVTAIAPWEHLVIVHTLPVFTYVNLCCRKPELPRRGQLEFDYVFVRPSDVSQNCVNTKHMLDLSVRAVRASKPHSIWAFLSSELDDVVEPGCLCIGS